MSRIVVVTAWATLALLLAWSAPVSQAASDDTNVSGDNSIGTILLSDGTTRVSLKVQLERGLRAMRPVEFKFLREVLRQVDKGKLPEDMVEQAFLWAQRQRSYRVQYFEKALQALAQQNNIKFHTKVSSFDAGFNQQ